MMARKTQVVVPTTGRLECRPGEMVLSTVHGGWVRFSRWVDGVWAEVLDSDTLAVLPDLVHYTQLA